MPRFKVVPYNKAQLDALANPASARQPEAYPDVLWDSQPFVNATTTQLRFFRTTQADATLGNLQTAGQLPTPQYFLVHYVAVDILFPNITGTTVPGTGNLNDVHLLVNAARATLALNIAGKPYGPWRVRDTHSAGAPVGFGWGTFTAPIGSQYGHVGPHDGGFCINGALIIPPTTDFSADMSFAAVQTLNTNNVQIQVALIGVRYRKVV